MKIKVCGNTLPQQVNALDELGVTFAGFIFYPEIAAVYGAENRHRKKCDRSKAKLLKWECL